MIRFFFPGFQILLLSLFSIAFTSINTVAQVSPEDYVTTWQTDVRGSGINQISIPAYGKHLKEFFNFVSILPPSLIKRRTLKLLTG